jgi:hypothetical protein
MSIIDGLSSKINLRPEESNKEVAITCLKDPSLLNEISAHFSSKNPKVVGDCAEVCTMTAQNRPELIAPLAEALCEIRLHPVTRVRWEAAHSLALVAALRSDLIACMIPDLMETIREDHSIIVRDYTIDILANYSSASESAALQAFPGLIESLQIWNGRHAWHALTGLEHTARLLPALHKEIRAIIQPFLSSDKAVIRKAAKNVCKAIG